MGPGSGVLLYKCRLCGNVIRNYEVKDVAGTLDGLAAVGFQPIDGGGLIVKTVAHHCGGGAYGLADIVGGSPHPARPPADAEEGP